MLQTSFSFKAASCAMANVGPRPNVTRLRAAENVLRVCVQSSSAAEANRSGRRSRAAVIFWSLVQVATRFSKAATEETKVLVAATLNSAPAPMGKIMSQADARGLFVSLTRATVMAPEHFARAADSMRSSLRPDWE